VCTILAATLLYGEWRLTQIFTSNEALSVAVVQAAVAPQLRGHREYRDANLTRYLALTREAATTHPALIFWPEHAVDFSLQQDSPLREAVFGVARDLGADLILGAQYAEYGWTDLHYHNSVFLIRHGILAGRYDKTHLLPFAEVNHFAQLFPRIHDHYEPGHRVQVLRATNTRVGAFVCFEAMYPSLVREFARLGADILTNPSNDGWFGAAAPARHALDIASVRAIENRRYLVRATTTGISAVIDPYGHMVTASEFGAPTVLTAPIYRSRAQTPYQRWGDMIAWIVLMVIS
jgi:apolipoprotein N-acyltransferase